MNGAFYQEEVTTRFKPSEAKPRGSQQELFADYVNRVGNVKTRLAHAIDAVQKLNDFCKSMEGERNINKRAMFIQILKKRNYIDDTHGVTYTNDMLGTGGILETLNALDDKVGEANDFVARLGDVGTKFIAALGVYIGRAQNEAVEQEQIDSLKHIRSKGDFILQVEAKSKELAKLSDKVSLKIQAIHTQTKNNNTKRYEAIKACLSQLKQIDELESSQITTTINAAGAMADKIASANRVLNAANKQQLTRDTQQVVDDVTRSMEAHKKYEPSGKSIPTMAGEAPFLKNEGLSVVEK